MQFRYDLSHKGALVLAGSGASTTPFPELLTRQPEGKVFMDVRFCGFCLRAELHGEDMDSVLASVTLNDLGIYEVCATARCAYSISAVLPLWRRGSVRASGL